jgi:hypothetical protein
MTDHQIIETMRSWAQGEPVWSHDKIVEHWGADFLMYRAAWARGMDAEPRAMLEERVERTRVMYDLRTKAIHEFGFSIPCRELLDALALHQPVVEVGAGSGYLTLLMRNRGIDVVGTDGGHGHSRITLGRYDPVQVFMPAKRAVRHYRDRTVFCSWPSLQETWFRQALRAMRIGQRAIIVEEDACCEQSTWDYRDAAFKELADIPLPAWPMLNDRAAAWVKKREVAAGKAQLWRNEPVPEAVDELYEGMDKLWSEREGQRVGPGDGGEHSRAAVDGAAVAQGHPQALAPDTERQGT